MANVRWHVTRVTCQISSHWRNIKTRKNDCSFYVVFLISGGVCNWPLLCGAPVGPNLMVKGDPGLGDTLPRLWSSVSLLVTETQHVEKPSFSSLIFSRNHTLGPHRHRWHLLHCRWPKPPLNHICLHPATRMLLLCVLIGLGWMYGD